MEKKLSEVMKELNKKYGAETVMLVNDKESLKIESFPTGCYSFDNIFGTGGVPKGRILDIYGEPSSGKSTMAMFIVAQIQKQGGTAVWIDVEYSFTSDYAKMVGVDTSKLILVQPQNAESALSILNDFVGSGEVDIVVVDSTGALVPTKELEGELEDANVALQARMMSKVLRMITPSCSKNKTSVLFISQTRAKIGIFHGASKDSTGGNALKFYCAVRLNVERIKTLKGTNDEVYGNRLRITATKNKIGKPFKSAEIELYFEKGLDVVGDILDVATEKKIVEKDGNTYAYDKQKLGVGRNSSRDFLEEHADVFDKIREQLFKLEEK